MYANVCIPDNEIMEGLGVRILTKVNIPG